MKIPRPTCVDGGNEIDWNRAAAPPPARPARSTARVQRPPIPPPSTWPRVDTRSDNARMEVHARDATWQERLPARSPPLLGHGPTVEDVNGPNVECTRFELGRRGRTEREETRRETKEKRQDRREKRNQGAMLTRIPDLRVHGYPRLVYIVGTSR